MTMTPAVFLFGIACALIQNVESDAFVCPKHVTGKLEGSVSITCEYSTITKANKYSRKFFCQEKGRTGKCQYTIASTNGYIHQNFLNRVHIEDNSKEGLIIVTLSNLRKTDDGTYICGLGTDLNEIKAMFSLVVTEDSVIPNEAKLVYGQLRGAVNFHCEFGDEYAAPRKYLCKIEKDGCKNVIDSSGAIDAAYQGRIILQLDEKRPASFTVKIIDLRIEDSGWFSCGVGNDAVEGDTIEFDLRINEETDIPQGSKLLSTRLGGSVCAQCNYDPKKNYTLKFWCKLGDSICEPLIKTDGYVKDVFEGRLLIHDDPTNGTMQVLMNQITKEDEGWYWCVLTDGKHDQTSTVQIKISEEKPDGLTGGKKTHVTNGETAKITCSYPCKYKSYNKYWCKWNNNDCNEIAFHVDDSDDGLSVSCENQELVLTIESISQKDSGWYWCGVKKAGRYGETIAVHVIVEEATNGVGDSDIKPRVRGNSVEDVILTTPVISGNTQNSLVIAVVLSVCAAVLVASAVFFIIRQKRKKNSDLVSVGSYTTNISMTALDNVIGKDNPAVIDTLETDISNSKDGAKIKKKGSQEDLDYSSFLIHHNGSPNEEHTA